MRQENEEAHPLGDPRRKRRTLYTHVEAHHEHIVQRDVGKAAGCNAYD